MGLRWSYAQRAAKQTSKWNVAVTHGWRSVDGSLINKPFHVEKNGSDRERRRRPSCQISVLVLHVSQALVSGRGGCAAELALPPTLPSKYSCSNAKCSIDGNLGYRFEGI
ncbi:hypothetical protein NDU88_002357 [Pleurodeles waltl]|uniref:Uncharacterized protein n=1 Tax=Pleurodeles waltl TaxID=8319 RepID=A0AAV7PF24_PLEWA|nr:hypothetical protein NDU88_002357 [Pleurodeles waltl]